MKRFTRTTVKTLPFVVLTLMLLLNVLVIHVNAQETKVSVIFIDTGTSSITVNEEDLPVNTTNPTPPFTVNITVSNVNNLYSWSIKLYFNNQTLNCTADWVWLPTDHVFGYTESLYEAGPFVEYDPPAGTSAVSYGVVLLPEQSSFDGSGTLCQMNFTGINGGTSALEFSRPLGMEGFTSLADPDMQEITFTVEDGNVIVIPEFPTLAILPLLMILTLVAAVIAKKTWSKKLQPPARAVAP